MKRVTSGKLVDQLTGEEFTVGVDGRTFEFSFDGQAWSVDLSTRSEAMFCRSIHAFIEGLTAGQPGNPVRRIVIEWDKRYMALVLNRKSEGELRSTLSMFTAAANMIDRINRPDQPVEFTADRAGRGFEDFLIEVEQQSADYLTSKQGVQPL